MADDAISLAQKKERIVSFIREKVRSAGSTGCVVGLSGGVDSALTATLCVEALGAKGVTALVMPDHRVTPEEDTGDALELSRRLNVECHLVEISGIHAAYMATLPPHRLAEGNLRARIRASLLYYYANLMNRLVVGTGDKSEIMLGYFTKYGDGAADILPIGDLYKTEVRTLARLVGVDEKIASKPSSPRLWPGHTAQAEIGLNYETVDELLRKLEAGAHSGKAALDSPAEKENLERVASMILKTNHKREPPPICRLS